MSLQWIESKGYDREGDRFHRLDLVNDDDRILATVDIPVSDDHVYTCDLHVTSFYPERLYTTLESAKKFCEAVAIKGLESEMEHAMETYWERGRERTP